MNPTRTEHDLLGERDVPAGRYYGIQTLRAVENFAITGIPIAHYPRLIKSLAYIKKAAALTNQELGLLDPGLADAIARACDEILAGALHGEFVVDVIQGGAGTSTNMNANEVIANRALELLGHEKGRYDVLHPLNHVNMSQSTNDVYPTALRLTLSQKLDGLMVEMTRLRDAFARKGDEFA
ncbi:MAG TPA: lyase family protein, partial [Anaerolineales bacterium]|nr:lyase family protein [Anaerolineales bacterium]